MKLTLIQTGDVPAPLADRFGPYAAMFVKMFEHDGAGFSYETIRAHKGEPLPDPSRLQAALITGSAAGVYDKLDWLEPLRDFIRKAHGARTKMVGVCFGHQVIAEALGGQVNKSEKGWGLGRHTYQICTRPGFFDLPRASVSVACSHQDQVISAPQDAKVLLASEFTPNAGLIYANGTTLSFQPHPEFDDTYTAALAELRRGQIGDELVDAAVQSLQKPSDSPLVARAISRFLRQ